MNDNTVPTAGKIADHIAAAAALIERNGLYIGSWWENLGGPWYPGQACCTVGALAVAVQGSDVNPFDFAGVTSPGKDDGPQHPVLAALVTELGFDSPAEVYRWSDQHEQGEVVARLRAAAASIRARGGVRA